MNEPSENVQNISLDETLDISSAAGLKTIFLAVLKNKTPVCVDARNIERVDTAALQVMTAFIQDANAQGQSVQWQGPSAALSQSADLLGLRNYLGLDGNSA